MKRWIRCETDRSGKTLYLSCHIDTSKILDGKPDPDYIRSFQWTLGGGMTAERAIEEAKALIEAEATATSRVKRAEEGVSF